MTVNISLYMPRENLFSSREEPNMTEPGLSLHPCLSYQVLPCLARSS